MVLSVPVATMVSSIYLVCRDCPFHTHLSISFEPLSVVSSDLSSLPEYFQIFLAKAVSCLRSVLKKYHFLKKKRIRMKMLKA